MDKIDNVNLKPLEKSNYVKPLKMTYEQNGKKLDWDLLSVHDSVAIVIYNISRRMLVLVKQFRPAVYIGNIPEEDRVGSIDTDKYPASLGFTLECCAGIVDKKLSLAEIAAEEILEECGYNVSPNQLKQIFAYRSGAGTTGSIQTLFYCEVTDEMKVNSGGGVEGELIEVVEMSIPDVKSYMQSGIAMSPPSFMFAMQWFLAKANTI